MTRTMRWLLLLTLFQMIFYSSVQALELVVVDTGNAAWQEAFREVAALYEKAHPDIKIVHQLIGAPLDALDKAAVMIAGGTAPDLVWGSVTAIERFAAQRLMEDLNSWIQRDRWNVNALLAPSVNGYQQYFRGEQLALPRALQHHAVFFNAELFDSAGLPAPRMNWTWDQMLQAAKVLTRDLNGDGQIDQYGFHFHGWIANPTFYMPMLHAFGGRVYNQERTKTDLLNPNTIRAFEALQTMHLVDGVSPTSNAGGVRTAGKLGMWYANTLDIPTYKFGFNWGLAPLPSERYGQGIGTTDVAWWIPKASRNKEQAWDFLKFLLSRDIQRMLSDKGYISVRNDTIADTMKEGPTAVRNALVNNLMNSNVNSLGLLAGPWHADNYTILIKGLQEVAQGTKPVRQIMSEVGPLLDANLAKPWPPKSE